MYEITQYVGQRRYVCKPFNPLKPKKSGPGDVFYILWTEGRRSRRKSTGETGVAEAQAFFQEWLTLETSECAAEDWTCEDLYRAKYLAGENERADAAWRHLGPVYGALRPADVTKAVEARYVTGRRAAGGAAATIRAEVAMLRASWNAAVKERLLPSDALPVLGPLPPNSPPRDRWLKDGEIERVMKTAEDYGRRAYLFCAIALDACARRTAIQELRWDQVDWDVNTIHFLPEGAEQTRKRRASVPMTKRLRAILEEAYATRRPSDPFVIGIGGRVNSAIRTISERSEVPGLTPHVFRHTAATRMARRGVSLWLIAKVLGNTVEQVEKVYAKHSPEMLQSAVDSIGE